jgi:serine/threonine protein kinase
MSSDVWAFGIVIWEIFTYGLTPWHGVTAKEIVRNIESGIRLPEPENIPSPFWSHTLETWLFNYQERPTFSYLASSLMTSMPKVCKVTYDCTQKDKLCVRRGNSIYILKEHEGMYLAQSVSSLEIGLIAIKNTDMVKDTNYVVPR